MTHTFVISDETVNSYGFVVLTSGIDTSRFLKNPVMYYMHERDSGVIGRWENIRVSGVRLLADAVFDEELPLGKEVLRRVESGFIRSASIGIGNVEREEINGIETVVKCVLKEVSIVDIPSNYNAVKLFRKDGNAVYRLSDLLEEVPGDFREKIALLLGLPAGTGEKEITRCIKEELKSTSEIESEVENAVKMGLISNSEANNYALMAQGNPGAFRALIADKKRVRKDELDALVDSAVKKGKFIQQDKIVFENVAECMGMEVLHRIIGCIPERVSLMELTSGRYRQRSEWSLSDYRKYDPLALKDNPELYANLLKKEGQEMELNSHTLEYYRRHNPEYLRLHPEEYRRLTNTNNK